MHEFSIASEISRNVLDAAEQNRAKGVHSISLDIGEFSLMNVDQVLHWVQALFKGTMAEGAKVKIKRIKAIVQCRSCGYRGRIVPDQKEIFLHYLSLNCPKCGGPDVKFEKGQECVLRKIQAVR